MDTVGVTDKAWVDEADCVRPVDTHFRERYTRRGQCDPEVTVTIDDPKFYTQPSSNQSASNQSGLLQDEETGY